MRFNQDDVCMSARYRIKEHKHTFTPQRRVLWMWFRIAKPQPTMQAASEIIRQRMRAAHPPLPVSPQAEKQNQE